MWFCKQKQCNVEFLGVILGLKGEGNEWFCKRGKSVLDSFSFDYNWFLDEALKIWHHFVKQSVLKIEDIKR